MGHVGGVAGLQVAMRGVGATAWEVRNSSSLLFTALLIRMLGFRNLAKVSPRPRPDALLVQKLFHVLLVVIKLSFRVLVTYYLYLIWSKSKSVVIYH